ncbi:MAG: hypothetical protein Q7R33_00885 [Nitrosarchaeum sp.]|nr:hypothetical protein [Nitrosarchaeum sp.]
MVKDVKYKINDVVGICSDCMADCRIVKILPNKEYIATAITIHHPKPKESFFGKNKKFTVKESQIVCKLSNRN